MSKGLEALDELMSVYFDNEVVKRKYGITEETAKEKRKIIEKELKALEIIKKFAWIEDGEIHLGLYGDIEIVLKIK
jgi:hypothetical protein